MEYGRYTEVEMQAYQEPSPLVSNTPKKESFFSWVKCISWLDWASITVALLVMYTFFAGIFWGCIEIAEAIRNLHFRVLPEEYYGPYVYLTYPPIPFGQTSYPIGFTVPWNSTLFS